MELPAARTSGTPHFEPGVIVYGTATVTSSGCQLSPQGTTKPNVYHGIDPAPSSFQHLVEHNTPHVRVRMAMLVTYVLSIGQNYIHSLHDASPSAASFGGALNPQCTPPSQSQPSLSPRPYMLVNRTKKPAQRWYSGRKPITPVASDDIRFLIYINILNSSIRRSKSHVQCPLPC